MATLKLLKLPQMHTVWTLMACIQSLYFKPNAQGTPAFHLSLSLSLSLPSLSLPSPSPSTSVHEAQAAPLKHPPACTGMLTPPLLCAAPLEMSTMRQSTS